MNTIAGGGMSVDGGWGAAAARAQLVLLSRAIAAVHLQRTKLNLQQTVTSQHKINIQLPRNLIQFNRISIITRTLFPMIYCLHREIKESTIQCGNRECVTRGLVVSIKLTHGTARISIIIIIIKRGRQCKAWRKRSTRHISLKIRAPQYQPVDRKRKGKIVEDKKGQSSLGQ